jgi:hypothetical protein
MAAAPGASLDWSSSAWFEALEIATAPRVRPPAGVVAACPGQTPASDPIDMVGDAFHADPMAPLELVVLSDADAVVSWALSNGLAVTPELYDGLATLTGMRFVVARFAAPNGEAWTPTLRVSGPDVSPTLPLVLTSATASSDLLVSAFTIAEGRTALDGVQLSIDASALSYDAASGDTNYASVRRAVLLGSVAAASLLEASSRTAWVDALAVGSSHVIEPAVDSYVMRAAIYEGFDGPACSAQVATAIDVESPVSPSCARADLGVVDELPSCTESVQAGEIDPALLRCGADADDIAVAMSEHVAATTWLTRHSVIVPASQSGTLRSVAVAPGSAVDPIHEASTLDLSGCESSTGAGGSGAGGSGAGGSGAGGSGAGGAGAGGAGSGGAIDVPVYELQTGCGAPTVGGIIYYIEVDETEPPDAYYQEQADCGGEASDSYTPVYEDDGESNGVEDEIAADGTEGDCGGEASDTYDESDSDDGCGGDSSESYESSDTRESSESSSDDPACTIARRADRPRRRPQSFMWLLALIALLTPLRRATRRSPAPSLLEHDVEEAP